jgi:hypothetical protein
MQFRQLFIDRAPLAAGVNGIDRRGDSHDNGSSESPETLIQRASRQM